MEFVEYIYSEPKPDCRDYGVREQDLFIKCKWHDRINQIYSFFISNHLTNEELKNKINEVKERIEDIEEKCVEEYIEHYYYDDNDLTRETVFNLLGVELDKEDDYAEAISTITTPFNSTLFIERLC